ncbi:hypothetical protein SAMN05421774_101809 [Gemmobacter megaterium]|uniref:Uncharacterized protein n=1 Tax=Gemmobacter megaterium TaxID=1086013 RepID=A0A1N7L084_9RHOB|nr:hypothetical protein GCM10011345_07920 [Gemmobacter megaterium]SIS67231.1 hypothetical protein SAMN05421774_101809 [Gemmobacter megaterium]
MCANPRELPANSKNGLRKPPRPMRANPRELPANSGAQTPSLSKERDYCVPPLGVRHKPIPVPDRIEALAARVLRLMVSHSNPERFFEERSEIAWELRKLAKVAQG